MGYRVDESEWPIVVMYWQGTLTANELTLALGDIDRFLARAERFGVLIDARGGGGASPDQRTRIVAHMKATEPLTRKYLIQASVFDNVLQRTLYYAVALLFPLPFPAKVFAQPEAALTWLREKLAEGPPSA